MTADPNFEDMTGPDLLAYLDKTTDHSAFVRWMRRGQPAEELVEPATRLTAVRLPGEMIDRLDELSAGDRQGRSGLIRAAIADFLAKVDHAARSKLGASWAIGTRPVPCGFDRPGA